MMYRPGRVLGHIDRDRRPDDSPALGEGYTCGMKTAVSVPDDLFKRVDRLARGSGRSRSEVYAAALREYVSRHAPDEITQRLDSVLANLQDDAPASDGFRQAAARRVLESTEW